MTSRSAVLADAALSASTRGDHPAAIRYAHAAAQAFNVELEAAGRGDAATLHEPGALAKHEVDDRDDGYWDNDPPAAIEDWQREPER